MSRFKDCFTYIAPESTIKPKDRFMLVMETGDMSPDSFGAIRMYPVVEQRANFFAPTKEELFQRRKTIVKQLPYDEDELLIIDRKNTQDKHPTMIYLVDDSVNFIRMVDMKCAVDHKNRAIYQKWARSYPDTIDTTILVTYDHPKGPKAGQEEASKSILIHPFDNKVVIDRATANVLYGNPLHTQLAKEKALASIEQDTTLAPTYTAEGLGLSPLRKIIKKLGL